MNQETKQEFIPISVPSEWVQALFEQEEISKHYQSVRNSERVEKCYREMKAELINCCTSKLFKKFLEDSKTEVAHEKMLRDAILREALKTLVQNGKGDIQGAVIAAITEENFLKEIADIKSSIEMTMEETKHHLAIFDSINEILSRQ